MVTRTQVNQQRQQDQQDQLQQQKKTIQRVDPSAARLQEMQAKDDKDNPNAQHPQNGVSSSELNSGDPSIKRQATKEAAAGQDNTKP